MGKAHVCKDCHRSFVPDSNRSKFSDPIYSYKGRTSGHRPSNTSGRKHEVKCPDCGSVETEMATPL